jgi:translation initiation factor IF-3
MATYNVPVATANIRLPLQRAAPLSTPALHARTYGTVSDSNLPAGIPAPSAARKSPQSGSTAAEFMQTRAIKDTRKRPTLFTPPTNDRITLPLITYIDGEGNRHENMRTAHILKSFDRKRHVLVLVNPALCICRLFRISEFMTHSRRIVAQTMAAARRNDTGEAKELQITWNVGDNDLVYRLQRITGYLQEGKRVSIIVGARKAKLVRNRAQRDAMIQKIRDTLSPYGREWRDMTGGFPNLELWFEGHSAAKDGQHVREAGGPKSQSQSPDPAAHAPPSLGTDEDRMSREELQVARANFKGKHARSRLRQEANKAYSQQTQKQTPLQSSQSYWEQLSLHTPKDQRPRPPPDASQASQSQKKKPGPPDPRAIAEKIAELNGPDAEKLEKRRASQARLQSLAAQFSKLAVGKSILGDKIAGR